MSLMRTLALFVATCLVALAPAGADTVHLKDGTKAVGVVIAYDTEDLVLLHHDGSRRVIPSAQVAKALRDDLAIREYVRRVKALPFVAVEQHYELARWCAVRGLLEPARTQLRHVLECDPDHAGARAMVGQHKVNGKWVARKEQEPAQVPAPPADGEKKPVPGKTAAQDAADQLDGERASTRAETLRRQIEQIRPVFPIDKRQRRNVERLVRKVADADVKVRKQARDELLLYARLAKKPALAQVAGKMFGFWDDYYSPRPSGGTRVVTDMRVQLSALTRPIPQRNISLGGTTSSQVRIQTPETHLIGVNTTAILPANRPRR